MTASQWKIRLQPSRPPKTEKKAKNELQRLRNLAKAKKIKIPKVGLPSTEHFKDSKQLSVGAKVFIIDSIFFCRVYFDKCF